MEEELLPNEGTEDAWVSTGGDKSNEQEEVMDMSLNEEMNQMTLENQEVENQKEEEEEEEVSFEFLSQFLLEAYSCGRMFRIWKTLWWKRRTILSPSYNTEKHLRVMQVTTKY